MLDEFSKKEFKKEFLPFLNLLAESLPRFGSVILRVKIHDYCVGSTTYGVHTSKKIIKRKRGT
jgi:hypothetical protein